MVRITKRTDGFRDTDEYSSPLPMVIGACLMTLANKGVQTVAIMPLTNGIHITVSLGNLPPVIYEIQEF